MPLPPTLPTTPPEHPSMDYAFLRQEGIRYLERLASELWTDFNAHDPGITILEQLCYAITDLAYRINYDLPDLLTRDGEDASASLYTPAQILPSHPVTLTDLRKLVIDIQGVKNAWIEKVSDAPLSAPNAASTAERVLLKGLYRVLIEPSDGNLTDDERASLKIKVAIRLHAHRNLCEDFHEVSILKVQKITVEARVEIEPVRDVESLLRDIYQEIADYISPAVPFRSLSELYKAGKSVDEIFDGPLLDHGFIDTAELERIPRRTVLHRSELIHAIMGVRGVQAVRTMSLTDGASSDPWSMTLDPNKTPRLDVTASSIGLEQNQLEVDIDPEQIKNIEKTCCEQREQALTRAPLPPGERDLPLPTGRDRGVGNYHSLQHQFPEAYGIGEIGLPAAATPQRQVQAKQLKAYLMFFDQILANDFAQLAHIKELFAFSGDPTQTYFSRMIDDPTLGSDAIRVHKASEHQTTLQQITADPYADCKTAVERSELSRRNRFLEHLLARFAEQFVDYALLQSTDADVDKLRQAKQAFLQDYPQISSARGTAFNILLLPSTANISGLEKRLRRKLGIVEPQEHFYLVEHILLRPMPNNGKPKPKGPVWELPIPEPSDPYSLQLSLVFPDWPGRFKPPDFKRFVERTVREETPAHLTLYIHWLDQTKMDTFVSDYKNWQYQYYVYRTTQLGLSHVAE